MSNYRRDRPKEPYLRTWLVKLFDLDQPIDILAEYRGAARYYGARYMGYHVQDVEWARLKRGEETNSQANSEADPEVSFG